MPLPLDVRFARRAEEKLGRALPDSYVAKMCKENGGELEIGDEDWQLYPILDDSDKTRLKRTCEDIVRETQSRSRWPGFPKGALAIAHNGTGDHLIFLPDENGSRFSNAVFLWNHETGELEEVAGDFSEL